MENNKNKLNILKLLDSKGDDKLLWLQVLKDIISGDDNLNYNIVSKLNQCLIENQNLELAIDIIDFIVDHGSDNLIKSIASEDFLKNLYHILSKKYKADRETQKLVVFLIKKWADKYKGKEALKNFEYIYDYMHKNGLYKFYDNSIKFETYLKYITINEIEMIKKLTNNLNSEKTVFNDPFKDEKIVKDKSENINHEERENIFVNEDAPPSFGEISNSTYSQPPEELKQNLDLDKDTENPPFKHKSSNDAINVDKPNINVQNNIVKSIPIKANDTENADKNKDNIKIYKSPNINENIKENNNENKNNKKLPDINKDIKEKNDKVEKIYRSPDISQNKNLDENNFNVPNNNKNDKVEKIYRSPDISQNKNLNENNFNAPNNEGKNNNKNEMAENINKNMNNINLMNNNINFQNNNNDINNNAGNRDFNQMNNYNNNYQYNNNIPYNQFNSGNKFNQIK